METHKIAFLMVLGYHEAMGTLAGGVLGFSSHSHTLGVAVLTVWPLHILSIVLGSSDSNDDKCTKVRAW